MKSGVSSIDLPLLSEYKKSDLRKEIMDYLFRCHSFEDLYKRNWIFEERDSYLILYFLEDKYPNLTLEKVHHIAEKNLLQIYYFMAFLKKYFTFAWYPRLDDVYRKTCILLHKFYRIAPVFNYKRARANLKTLQELLSRIGFWPQVCTQIALIIFITDKNRDEKEYEKPLLQKNIRAFCNCSAYAFHRARKIIQEKTNIAL